MNSAQGDQVRSAMRYAVVGATGAVGRAMLRVLAQRRVPMAHLTLAASERSAGRCLQYDGRTYTVQALPEVDFSQIDIALFSAGGETSRKFVPLAAKAGCVVIDNSAAFRYEEGVPLIVPEINPDQIDHYRNRRIIANPNCSTIAMLLAVQPIHQAVGVRRIEVATYQAVSGAGDRAVRTLHRQSMEAVKEQSIEAPKAQGEPDAMAPFAKPIAFNVLPQIGDFQENGFTHEEMKMIWETHKILDASIVVNPSCVRVPVVCGHSLAVHLHTKEPISRQQAIDCLTQAKGVQVLDEHQNGGYPTPLTEGADADAVFVGRIRPAFGSEPGLNLWVVGDNLLKGAALNAVQIAEHLAPILAAQR